jgi:hypothetical protein
VSNPRLPRLTESRQRLRQFAVHLLERRAAFGEVVFVQATVDAFFNLGAQGMPWPPEPVSAHQLSSDIQI